MKLDLRSLTRGLTYHGEVVGMRQTYWVLSSPRQYFVLSQSRSKRSAGNFNLVSGAAVQRLQRRLRGQQSLTSRRVFERSRSRRSVPSSLAALNMLYVLVATGHAAIDRRHHGRELHFNVRAGGARRAGAGPGPRRAAA